MEVPACRARRRCTRQLVRMRSAASQSDPGSGTKARREPVPCTVTPSSSASSRRAAAMSDSPGLDQTRQAVLTTRSTSRIACFRALLETITIAERRLAALVAVEVEPVWTVLRAKPGSTPRRNRRSAMVTVRAGHFPEDSPHGARPPHGSGAGRRFPSRQRQHIREGRERTRRSLFHSSRSRSRISSLPRIPACSSTLLSVPRGRSSPSFPAIVTVPGRTACLNCL